MDGQPNDSYAPGALKSLLTTQTLSWRQCSGLHLRKLDCLCFDCCTSPSALLASICACAGGQGRSTEAAHDNTATNRGPGCRVLVNYRAPCGSTAPAAWQRQRWEPTGPACFFPVCRAHVICYPVTVPIGLGQSIAAISSNAWGLNACASQGRGAGTTSALLVNCAHAARHRRRSWCRPAYLTQRLCLDGYSRTSPSQVVPIRKDLLIGTHIDRITRLGEAGHDVGAAVAREHRASLPVDNH